MEISALIALPPAKWVWDGGTVGRWGGGRSGGGGGSRRGLGVFGC